jgi:hypothetical protein
MGPRKRIEVWRMRTRHGLARPPILELLVIVAAVALCRGLLSPAPVPTEAAKPISSAPQCLAPTLREPVYDLTLARSNSRVSVVSFGEYESNEIRVASSWAPALSDVHLEATPMRCGDGGLLVRIDAINTRDQTQAVIPVRPGLYHLEFWKRDSPTYQPKKIAVHDMKSLQTQLIYLEPGGRLTAYYHIPDFEATTIGSGRLDCVVRCLYSYRTDYRNGYGRLLLRSSRPATVPERN